MSSPQHYTVVFLHEDNGTVSAFLPDLPGVYASADTRAGARKGIREAMAGYVEAMAGRGWTAPTISADVAVMRVEPGGRRPRVRLLGVGALLGRKTSPTKAATSRANGLKGGRPRPSAAAGTTKSVRPSS
jgi:predicted RNase H-like HicB family nuclease